MRKLANEYSFPAQIVLILAALAVTLVFLKFALGVVGDFLVEARSAGAGEKLQAITGFLGSLVGALLAGVFAIWAGAWVYNKERSDRLEANERERARIRALVTGGLFRIQAQYMAAWFKMVFEQNADGRIPLSTVEEIAKSFVPEFHLVDKDFILQHFEVNEITSLEHVSQIHEATRKLLLEAESGGLMSDDRHNRLISQLEYLKVQVSALQNLLLGERGNLLARQNELLRFSVHSPLPGRPVSRDIYLAVTAQMNALVK